MTHLQAVIDIGKTLSKVTLWDSQAQCIACRKHSNQTIMYNDMKAIDIEAIAGFIEQSLTEFATLGTISCIFPVAHGACCVLVRRDATDGAAICPPLDYEQALPPNIMAEYRALCDPFALTGSPPLPAGLNLGAQIYALQTISPELLNDAVILLWPQYWAWRLSGVMASEITSLGCHSDLWFPGTNRFSDLAQKMGWAKAFAPLRCADQALGPITSLWAKRTGLSTDTIVYTGIHDSNAALIAARGFLEISQYEATILSTGTWFVAMRSPENGTVIDIAALPQKRDCLVNVDAFGAPIPSARFMGGREIEALISPDCRHVDIPEDQPALLAAVPQLIADNVMALPSFAGGTGPFPDHHGHWLNQPNSHDARRSAACLYAALMADISLQTIGSRGAILIEGRFAKAHVFARMLASLRPDCQIYVSLKLQDLSFGALRLMRPEMPPLSGLIKIEPLDHDVSAYAANWTAAVNSQRIAA